MPALTKFKPTMRSPQSQKSSKWKSMLDPFSSLYSRMLTSAGSNVLSNGISYSLSIIIFEQNGKPLKFFVLIFFSLKFTYGPQSIFLLPDYDYFQLESFSIASINTFSYSLEMKFWKRIRPLNSSTWTYYFQQGYHEIVAGPS